MEGTNVDLADCFIQLVKLAININKIPTEQGIIGFKNHCIKVINDQWKSFEIQPYLLAYYLHPLYRGKYKLRFKLKKKMLNKLLLYLGTGLKSNVWSELTKYAGSIFWNMSKINHNNDKVAYMIGQMANFKCNESYYSTKYSDSFNKPKIWWTMVDDPVDYLKSLAIKLFSITPHSVACEKAFSILGFFYGKKRQCLNLSTIEKMAKIKYYLFLNIKGELNYTKEETETELKILVEECGLFNEDEDDEDNEDNENDNSLNDEELTEIPIHEVCVLIINNIVDMNNSVFTGELNEEICDDGSDENDEEEDQQLDFEKIAEISAPSNM